MTVDLRLGDCLQVLRELPDCSVQCCVTSPPYYGLRDYGIDGQIGLEPAPEEYIARLVAVFAEVRRVLKDDGTLWLNLGDSYWTDSAPRKKSSETFSKEWNLDNSAGNGGLRRTAAKHGDWKNKDLLMIPARVALALQADGWYLRSEIIWHKPNSMPESVRDRPTKAHEMIYLLAKSQRYYYDAEAVKEEITSPSSIARNKSTPRQVLGAGARQPGGNGEYRHVSVSTAAGRNRRDVWTVTTKPYKEAHFATFPPDLIEPCILAGTSERGECPKCGKAWVRVVKVETNRAEAMKWHTPKSDEAIRQNPTAELRNTNGQTFRRVSTTLGWRPSCSCIDESDYNGPFEPVPQTVLDPFNGSGTTGAVSVMHGRQYIGIELNPAYIELSQKRIDGTQIEIPA